MAGERAIGRFTLLERLGDSDWWEVHRARDSERGRTVALKLTAPGTLEGDARAAFLEAARAAATLSHPNIATLYDWGEADGCCYLAYEFAPGPSLEQETAGQPMNQWRALELASQVAEALAAAHAHGIIHGDLRPGTVVVTSKGNAKVLDFGMSRWSRAGAVRARAAACPEEVDADAMRIVGYLSPEQALGGLVDGRTDVFSLGVMLHEMLTGTNPFAAGTVADTIVRIVGSAPPPPSSLNRDVSPSLDALVLGALAKDIERRPQGAVTFAAELRGAGAVGEAGAPESRAAAEPSFGDEEDRRGRARWWAVAVAGLALGATVFWWFYR